MTYNNSIVCENYDVYNFNENPSFLKSIFRGTDTRGLYNKHIPV
jgi:hypothetical protein